MAKYSYEFKKKVVQAYLNGEGGYTHLAEKYDVKNKRQVLNWVHSYNELGDDGLIRSRQNKKYSFQFKLSVVELYLSSEVSYQELALSQGINNSALIARGSLSIVGVSILPYAEIEQYYFMNNCYICIYK